MRLMAPIVRTTWRRTGPSSSSLANRARQGGRFVLCDVVIADGPVGERVPLEDGVDLPSTVEDQLGWLHAAGLHAEVVHAHDDLAILSAERPGPPRASPPRCRRHWSATALVTGETPAVGGVSAVELGPGRARQRHHQ